MNRRDFIVGCAGVPLAVAGVAAVGLNPHAGPQAEHFGADFGGQDTRALYVVVPHEFYAYYESAFAGSGLQVIPAKLLNPVWSS